MIRGHIERTNTIYEKEEAIPKRRSLSQSPSWRTPSPLREIQRHRSPSTQPRKSPVRQSPLMRRSPIQRESPRRERERSRSPPRRINRDSRRPSSRNNNFNSDDDSDLSNLSNNKKNGDTKVKFY